MPKWTNKGHEFYEIGNYFETHKNIVVTGSQEDREYITKKLSFLGVKINSLKKFRFFNKKNLISKVLFYINEWFYLNYVKKLKKTSIIITPERDYHSHRRMLEYGFTEGKNLFIQKEFLEKYLHIYAVYAADKVYFPSNCFICTTVCTLNCRHCLNFAPYDKNKHHFDIQRLKRDVDTYFKHVDRVELFHISGGEPFSYPKLEELIEYIGKNYRNKISIFGIVSNATIIPGDNLCKLFKKYDMRVELDDYTVSVKNLQNNLEKIRKKLEQYNVCTQLNVPETFFELFPPKNVKNEYTEAELIAKFDACANMYTELKNQKLYNCNYSEFAAEAGVFIKHDDEAFDLTGKFNKKELVEYRYGYSNKGYVEFCKYCNGIPPCNNNYVKPAVQSNCSLEWDINYPEKVKNVLE